MKTLNLFRNAVQRTKYLALLVVLMFTYTSAWGTTETFDLTSSNWDWPSEFSKSEVVYYNCGALTLYQTRKQGTSGVIMQEGNKSCNDETLLGYILLPTFNGTVSTVTLEFIGGSASTQTLTLYAGATSKGTKETTGITTGTTVSWTSLNIASGTVIKIANECGAKAQLKTITVVHNGTANPCVYAISYDTDGTSGCSVSGPPYAAAGETVNFTITPASGYASAGTMVYDDTYDIMNELLDPGVATFTMPASDVNVYAFFTTSCTTDPTIGNAGVGASFTLTSLTQAVSVSSGSCSPGSSGCTWTDFGLVWGTSSTPTVSNNKKQVYTSGTTTSFSNNIQPSGSTTPTAWVVGTTYYVRTYGKNAKDGAAYNYGTATSFILRSITFNSNGGSSVGTIYPKSGGTATQPSNPTKTGYDFAGWYQEAELTNAVNWSSTITANKTYYAKWTPKNYALTWNLNGGTVTVAGTGAAVNATGSPSSSVAYGSAITAPTVTKTGYTFSGWNTTPAGTMPAANTTYTAQWTPNVYTVTWMVNGASYSTGTPSTSVNHGEHVATLPTAPDPNDNCGAVFAGWTTTNIGGTGLDKDADADAISDLNLFTTAGGAPTATGNQTFYAVFADYAD